MWKGPQGPGCRGTKAAPTFSHRSAFHLSACDRTDIRNIPPYTSESFHSGNDPDDNKRNVNERLNDPPKKRQDSANCWNRPEDQKEDPRHYVEQKPSAAEDDRLHGVEAHKVVALLQDVKNDAADQRNTRNCRSNIRG